MKTKRHGLIAMLVVLMVFVGAEVTYGFNLSLWDPMGKAFNSIEEKVPGLLLRGFVRNRTYYCLDGRTNHEGIAGIPKRWDFTNIFWESEFEWHYKFNSNVELVNILAFQYDAVPDWVVSLPASGNHYARHYRNFREQILRELYLGITQPSWYLRLGKQQVVWGKMEGPLGGQLNKVNPGDFREGQMQDTGDHEWYRIPTWMANFTYYWPDYYLQLLWIPDFEEDRGPYRGTTWQAPTSSGTFPPFFRIRGTDRPSESEFKNHSFGARFNLVKKGWDISFIYLWKWSYTPAFFKRAVTFNPAAPPRTPPFIVDYEYEHKRQHHIGFDVDKAFWFFNREWVFRNETIYNTDNYVSDNTETTFMPGVDGLAKRDNIECAIALEASWFKGELTTTLQPSMTHYFGWKHTDGMWPGKDLAENWYITVLALRKLWYDDRLGTFFTGYWWHHDGAFKSKLEMTWDFSDVLTMAVNYWNYSGNRDDIVGRYRDWDTAGFELMYAF